MTTTTNPTIEFTDDIAQAVRDAQFAIDLGQESPDLIARQLVDTIGQDRLSGALRIQHLYGLVRQIHQDIHENHLDTDRSMIEDFETFKRIIVRTSI